MAMWKRKYDGHPVTGVDIGNDWPFPEYRAIALIGSLETAQYCSR